MFQFEIELLGAQQGSQTAGQQQRAKKAPKNRWLTRAARKEHAEGQTPTEPGPEGTP
jgi:hypothetical protein